MNFNTGYAYLLWVLIIPFDNSFSFFFLLAWCQNLKESCSVKKPNSTIHQRINWLMAWSILTLENLCTPSNHAILVLLYKFSQVTSFVVISWRFQISFQRLPKITKDCQTKTSIEGPKVFRSDKTKLSVLKGTKICHKTDIFTCEDLPVGLVDSFCHLPGGHLIFIENILQEIQVTDWSTVSTIWNFWEQLLIIVFGHMAQKVKYDKAQSINVSWCSCDLVTYTNTNLSWSCRDTRQCHLCCCTDVCVPFVLDCILLLLC